MLLNIKSSPDRSVVVSERPALLRVLVIQSDERADHQEHAFIFRGIRGMGPAACVERVSRVEVAQSLLEQQHFDAVVLDVVDLQAPEKLIQSLYQRSRPLVVVSQKESNAEQLALLQAGATECISAHAGPEVLRAALVEQIRSARDQLRRDRDAERRQAVAQLGGAFVQSVGVGLLWLDSAGRISFANAEAERILGKQEEQLLEQSFVQCFPSDTPEQAEIAAALQDGMRIRSLHTALHSMSGEVVPLSLSLSRIVEPPGAGWIAVLQDLSELQELQRNHLQSEKMASIGQLAAGVAHEINNPVGFIDANLKQMAEYVTDLRSLWSSVDRVRAAKEDADAEKLVAAVEMLAKAGDEFDADFLIDDLDTAIRESQEGSERIRHIVQDLRDFTRADRNAMERSDLIQCLDSTANIAWGMMKHSVHLEKDYAPLPPVECIAMQLKQVFLNLLVNAYHAIREKHGSKGMGIIRLEARSHGNHVEVSISDDGIGIAPENCHRIFDPFFTTKGVGEGVGLGLSTSYHIVKSHGGSLRVSSEHGAGSCFRLTLPLKQDQISQ